MVALRPILPAPPGASTLVEEPPLLDLQALAELERRCGPDILAAMLACFLAESPRRAATAGEALRRGDATALRQLAHDLASSAGSIGACAVHGLARDVELACRGGRLEEAFDLAALLPPLIDAAAEALTRRYPQALQPAP